MAWYRDRFTFFYEVYEITLLCVYHPFLFPLRSVSYEKGLWKLLQYQMKGELGQF
jgi:hypothetical protein